MAKIIRLVGTVLMVGAAVSVAACGSSTEQGSTEPGSVESTGSELTGSGPYDFYGSDTLFDVTNDALATWNTVNPLTLRNHLLYKGTGSGNGENCMRGTGASPCNVAGAQTIAPMSRDLNAGCTVAGTGGGTLKTHKVGLDGIGLWTENSANHPTDLSSAQIKQAFCGSNGDGTGTCPTTWSGIYGGNANTVTLYRRDDVSGTTDTFKTLLACTGFCSNVKIVVDDPTAGPRLSTDSAGTSSIAGSGKTCLTADSATKCIGKLAGTAGDVLGYAGLEAGTVSPTPRGVTVDTIAATTANIRKLVTGVSGKYPLARFLYLNELTGSTKRTAQETDYLNWAFETGTYAGSGSSTDFETALTGRGFITCNASTPLACGTTGNTCL